MLNIEKELPHHLRAIVPNTVDMPDSTDTVIDDATLKILFREHFKPLCAWCAYKFDFDMDEAKESVHSAFIKLWENRGNITPGLPVRSYLYTLVTNISLDRIRHEKVKQKYARFVSGNTSLAATGEGFDGTSLRQLSSDIDQAIAALPEKMRLIFELSRFEGLKYAQIAGKLNISIKTVETQMSRALIKLKQQLAQYLTLIGVAILLSL